jgi:hypothetical protein
LKTKAQISEERIRMFYDDIKKCLDSGNNTFTLIRNLELCCLKPTLLKTMKKIEKEKKKEIKTCSHKKIIKNFIKDVEIENQLSEKQVKAFYKNVSLLGGLHNFADKNKFSFEDVLMNLAGTKQNEIILSKIKKLARGIE